MAGTAPATPASIGAAPSLAGRRLGRYQVLSQLAAGGMAGVYVARALAVAGFERLVALKVLHPHLAHEEEFISMFLDEARLAARIHHPNVVATLDISDTEGDGYFLVMDYIEGHHFGALLQQAAKDGVRVPPPIVLRVVLDALAGLGAAHDLVDEQGAPLKLVHRDVSPHNIMVGTDGIGRLTDFGVAKAEVRLTSTREGQFKGKLAYMAPEHASTGVTDQRSDLFAMGIILWEGLTGRRLFRGDTNAATLNKILLDPIQLPSEARPELEPFDAVCMRALERNADLRFQSADEFAQALEAVAPALGGIATARQVGEMVRKLAGEKISRDKARIHEAIRGLASSEAPLSASIPAPRNASEPSMPSMPSRSRSMPVGSWADAQTATATATAGASLPGIPLPGELGPPPGGPDAGQPRVAGEQPARKSPMIVIGAVAAALLVLGALGVGAYLATRPAAPDSPPNVAAATAPSPALPPVIAAQPPTPPSAVPPPAVGTTTAQVPENGATTPTAAPTTDATDRPRRHHGRDARGTGAASGGSEDDELLNNPYRR
jgi:serine/threonine-protein kinase